MLRITKNYCLKPCIHSTCLCQVKPCGTTEYSCMFAPSSFTFVYSAQAFSALSAYSKTSQWQQGGAGIWTQKALTTGASLLHTAQSLTVPAHVFVYCILCVVALCFTGLPKVNKPALLCINPFSVRSFKYSKRNLCVGLGKRLCRVCCIS